MRLKFAKRIQQKLDIWDLTKKNLGFFLAFIKFIKLRIDKG